MTEFRPGGFQVIPTVIKNLLIINVLVFFAQMTFRDDQTGAVSNLFALHDIRSDLFRPHQLITHLFMHGGFGHLFFNMFALWMFGSTLENMWGAKRFLIFYMACGLGAAILHLGVLYFELSPYYAFLDQPLSQGDRQKVLWIVNQATLGASGAVFGCLAAFGYLFPNSLIYLYFFFPVKVKYFVIFYAAMELYLGIQNSAGDNVAHWAHLGGAAVGIVLVMYWNRKNRRNFY